MSDPTSTAAAGWYPDPHGAPVLRWWDGTAWTEHSSPLPGTYVQPQRTPLPADSRIDTVWIWLLAALPLVSIASFFLIDFSDYFRATMSGDIRGAFSFFGAGYLAAIALGWLAWGAGAFFAYRDWRGLQAAGVIRPFHWAWAFIAGMVYLIGRTVILRKVTSTQGLPPLWAGIAVYVVVFLGSIIWTVLLTQQLMQSMYDYLPGVSSY